MGSKETIAIAAFRQGYANYLSPLFELGYGPGKVVLHTSKLHSSWTDISSTHLEKRLEVSISLFTSSLWGKLEGSVLLSLARNIPSNNSDDYLNFRLFLNYHGIYSSDWRFSMENVTNDEIGKECDRVVKNCAELLFTHGLDLLTGRKWETGHYERKD